MKADGGVPAGEGYQKPIPFRIVNQIGQVEIKIEYLYHIPNTQYLQPCTCTSSLLYSLDCLSLYIPTHV